MTTRITLAILLTTWVILIIGETAAFLTARQSLLALLDGTIISRATGQVESLVGSAPPADRPARVPQGDRFEIRDDQGNLIAASAADPSAARVRPSLTRSEFATAPDGTRMRTIALRMLVS